MQHPKPAVERAAIRWTCEAALHVRGVLRARGVRGQLRFLDDLASGARGSAADAQTEALLRVMRVHGMAEADALAILHRLIAEKTARVYRDDWQDRPA